MAELLTNIVVGDNYTQLATLGPALDVQQLVFQVFNEPVYARFFKPSANPDERRQPIEDPIEHYFPVGTLLSVDGAAGAQFRNAIAGQPATINAEIAFVGDPIFDFQSSGLFSAAVLTLSFLHNNSLIGAESALDFEDSAQIQWSVVDTPGTKEAVSASFVAGSVVTSVFGRTGAVVATTGDYTAAQVTNAADKSSAAVQIFSAALSTGPSSQTFSGAQTTGVFVGITNGITAFNSVTFALINSGLTTDTFARFGINSSGLIQWGPGNAALDTQITRNSAGRLIMSGVGIAGRFDVQSVADADFPFTTFRSGDSQPKWAVRGDGSLGFGPGGATALDTTLVRLAASVLGAGSGDSLTTNALSTFTFGQQGVALQAVGTVWAAAAAAGNNTYVSSITGDTERRLGIQADGSIVWGSGSAATDVKLARLVNSPTGTGSFLELTAGAGFGYGVGTGGVIASIVSGSSGTLNKPTGKFTGSAAIATGSFGTYTVSNTCVGADDVVIVNLQNGGGNIQRVLVTAVAAGSFTVLYENASGVSATPVVNFAVIKGAQS